VYLLDTDVLIDIQREYVPALTWFTTLTELPAVPGLVVMDLIQDAQNARQGQAVVPWSSRLSTIQQVRSQQI
jgi:predicted nucleic acid-binding protein